MSMFKKKEFTRGEAYELRSWLHDFSNRADADGDDGQRVIYRLGRQFGKLKPFAEEFESALEDLRVKYGKFEGGKFVVDIDEEAKFSKFKEEFEAMKSEKVKVDFLTDKIDESYLEELKGVKVSDYDYLPIFLKD